MSYTIGQVAQMMNMTAYTLRYYDKEGLLPFVKRTKAGVRIFEESDLHFLQVLICLKKTGMQLEDIRNFILWIEEGDASLQKRYDMFVRQREEVDQQLARLNEYRECIEYKCSYYKKALEAGTEAVCYSKNPEGEPPLFKKIPNSSKEE